MTKPISPTDPILGPARGSVDLLLGYLADWSGIDDDANYAAVKEYIRESYRLAPLVGIDPAIVVSQSALETDNWRSEAWVKRRNPAGLGILGDPGKQSEDLGYKWANGTDAARAQIGHLLVYLGQWQWLGDNGEAEEKLGIAHPFSIYDPRFSAVTNAHLAGTVRTIQDLSNKWATVPDYGERVARRGNELFGFTEETTPMTFGNVPHPGYFDRPIWKPEGVGQNNLGKREPFAICLHRMIGTLWGTDAYFRLAGTAALTDYGVGTAFTDGTDQAGVIIKWNDPHGNQTPWASGPWSYLGGDAAKFVQRFGVNGINKNIVSIETSGKRYTDPIDAFALGELIKLVAYWADQMKIPHDQWPKNPATGLSAIYDHSKFQDQKPCAGAVVIDLEDPEIIEGVRAILKTAQTGGVVQPGPVITPPVVIFTAFPKPIVAHTVPMATSRQYGNRQARIVRTYKQRTAVKLGGYYHGESVGGDDRWFVIISKGISDNARIHASGIEEDIAHGQPPKAKAA